MNLYKITIRIRAGYTTSTHVTQTYDYHASARSVTKAVAVAVRKAERFAHREFSYLYPQRVGALKLTVLKAELIDEDWQ